MSIRHLTAALAATLTLTALAPAAAHASVSQELRAGGVVERMATRHYPRYDFVASCDQYANGRFWCMVSGQSGDCWRQGHASVRLTGSPRRGWDWWVTLRGLDQQCF